MSQVELVADTNIVSYIFKKNALGSVYRPLLGQRRTGVTLLTIAELRSGVESDDWGPRRRASPHAFLGRFVRLEATTEIANVCGGTLGRCKQIGIAMKWPDAWSATALWLDVPLAEDEVR
jgi:predicted nucleic acid-binding protein